MSTVLAFLPEVSSTFSFCGSLWILVEVITHRNKRHHFYHRLLAAMCFYDVGESFLNFMSTWPIPADNTSNVYHARAT